MDAESLTACIQTDHIYKDIAEVVETRFYTPNQELQAVT